MERSLSLRGRASWSRMLAIALLLLLSGALTLGPTRRVAAQAGNTHIVISEVVGELDGTDRARYYFEFANLGTTDFDFAGCWIYMWSEPSQAAPLAEKLIRIAGTGGASAP